MPYGKEATMSTPPIPPNQGPNTSFPIDTNEESDENSQPAQKEHKKMTTGGPDTNGMTLAERMKNNKIKTATPNNTIKTQPQSSPDTPAPGGIEEE
jgi:hypothetical protein